MKHLNEGRKIDDRATWPPGHLATWPPATRMPQKLPGDAARAMKLDMQIKEAFAGRTIPSNAINPQLDTSFLGPDETDAFWFQGRDWQELTRDDWQRHYCGIFFFTADALAYYLPSIMLHSMGRQCDVFLAADSLLLVLEGRTPIVEKCQHHVCDCLAMSSEEHDAVVRWMRYLRSTSEFKTGSQRERVNRALAVWAGSQGLTNPK